MAPLDRAFHLSSDLAGMRRLLFIDSGELSDIIFWLPVIEELARVRPTVEMHMMVSERWLELLGKESSLSDLIVYRPEQLRSRSTNYFRLLREVRERSFDAVFLMGEDCDPARDLIAYASQAPLRIGTYHDQREPVLNCMLRWKGRDRYKNELAEELARMIGLRYRAKDWRYRPRDSELRAAEQIIHFRKPRKSQMLFGVDPDPGKGSRRFATDNLRYLVDHLSEKFQAKIMLFHLEQEAAEIDAFRDLLRGEVLDMPSGNMRETLALLSRCDLFLAGNTELFHVAAAQGVPSVGLFTEADGRRWEPRGREDILVLRGRPGEKLALDEIEASVQRVIDANFT
jgi:ADP-heptose:LPS heptosyltransferase